MCTLISPLVNIISCHQEPGDTVAGDTGHGAAPCPSVLPAAAHTAVCRLFKGKFLLEYMFVPWGLLCYYVPGLDKRRRIMAELRSMFRTSFFEHKASIDPNHPR